MTLGNAPPARVRLVVWRKECEHQVEPDPAAMAARSAPKRGQELCGCATQLGKTEIVG